MDSTNKKSPKRPVAPPVYRPQPEPKVLLRKTANAAMNGKSPLAPPVYRPQPVPKVLQKKSASVPAPRADQATRKPVAPPVYRPEAKKILQPKAITPQRKSPAAPAVSRQHQRGIAPRETAFKTKTPPVLKSSSVVQRMRHHLPYELGYVVVPDTTMDSYTQHVKMRTRHFFRVVLNAVLEMQRQKRTVTPNLFTNTAKAQEAKGYRLGKEAEDKLDAAHLMNTTLVTGAFADENEWVESLYRSSAATTTQFQKSNVGPDKVIDSQQTRTKNAMLYAIQHGATVDHNFVANWVLDYLNALKRDLAVPLPEPEGVLSQSRAAAMRAVYEDASEIATVVREIESELKL